MMTSCRRLALLVVLLSWPCLAVEKPDITYKVFQFPANMIPRIDGNTDDWNMVPEDYVIGTDQLTETLRHNQLDPKNLDVRVRVGWVKGLNRLYFLYEASDNYWDFARNGLSNDIFELVVDGDLSGGPLIDQTHRAVWTPEAVGEMSVLDKRLDPSELHWSTHGVHAQNYHIFTPAVGKDWAMAWGCQPYIKDLPYANAAYNYNFKHGESGKLVLEFWITPFDYAGCEGPQRAVESVLRENKLIGLSWAVIDYDGRQGGFWNLSPKADHVRQRHPAGGFQADAARTSVQEADHGPVVLPGCGYEPPARSISRTCPKARSHPGSGNSEMARLQPNRTPPTPIRSRGRSMLSPFPSKGLRAPRACRRSGTFW